MTTEILVADDHRLFRHGLRMLLERHADLRVVGEASGGEEACELSLRLCPAIVLMDISMPDMSGIEATRRIIAAQPGSKIIGLSMHRDKRYVQELFRAGAVGYLLKDCAFEEIVSAISHVRAGKTYLSALLGPIELEPAIGQGHGVLSRREVEVLKLLAEGKSTKEIGGLLDISPKTVETHRRQVMGKLNLHTVAELTKYAIRSGLTTVDEL